MAAEQKKRGLVAFDIERTGNRVNRDIIVAVGVASAAEDATTDAEIKVEQFFVTFHGGGGEKLTATHEFGSDGILREIQPSKEKSLGLDHDIIMKNGDSMSEDDLLAYFRKIWSTFGYEQRCFNEFWSKNVRVLCKLQVESANMDRVGGMKEMANRLDTILLESQGKYSSYQNVSDTIGFDLRHLNNLLQAHGFAPMETKRDGTGYIGGIECDSYAKGALGLPLDTEWKDEIAAYDEKMASLLPELTCVHDHMPGNDAKSHLVKVLRANHYLKLQQQAKAEREESPKRARAD
jgi:hypothetical protein